MVGSEFLDYSHQFQLATYIGVEDLADKLNFVFTVIILLLCSAIITVKQYFIKPIACYIANSPGGSDFDDYLENYCFAHGTIPLHFDENTPQNNDWDDLDDSRRISYYQWVPFVLGVQCIMFYLPRIVWQTYCYNQSGSDLESIIKTAASAGHTEGEERKTILQHVTKSIENLFITNRNFAPTKKAPNQWQRCCWKWLSIFTVSRRLGTGLICVYLLVKVMYLCNAVFQLYLMQHFLGFNSSVTHFGAEVLHLLLKGQDWQETLFFPRVGFCNVDNVRHLGTTLRYTGQCALPVNMLNEKIYIFLWFWTVLVVVLTAVSIPLWLYRMARLRSRTKYIKKYLRVCEAFTAEHWQDRRYLDNFVQGFLRVDGVFLMHMISLNTGDLIATEVLACLWSLYMQNYKNVNFSNCPSLRVARHYVPNYYTDELHPPSYRGDEEEGEFV